MALLGAAEAAKIRLNQASLGVAPAFGPMGEVLMWVIALDDLLRGFGRRSYVQRRDGDPNGCVIPGLRVARNQVVHGVTVVETYGVRPGSQPGMFILGLSQLGGVQTLHWLPSKSLPLPGQRQGRGTEAAYDAHVANQEVLGVLAKALHFLSDEVGPRP